MKATLTQLAGLISVIVGAALVAGLGGALVAVGADLVYVGLAMED
jgi:hypothetical protein